ncbi:MAG: FeoB-associated Cys-rich membrane protein [Desulfurivibrionaceae bacterium]|nr:FeoB-associated Cys-rich membrane protein [Desulfobulbales bacterium]MDT8334093.1 FeoB-associated Cys-rich membrane protein [Desulfurivibrionaceae bacterium]
MLENIILWLIIAGAALYCGRTIYRTLSGRSRGCGCGCDCGEERTSPPLQQKFPDLTGKKDKPRD